MSHVALVVFVLGVIIQISKIGDLALRPAQQAKVDAFFKNAAIRLEAIRPIQWLALTTSPVFSVSVPPRIPAVRP